MNLSPPHASFADVNRPTGSLRFDSPAPARFSADEFLRMVDLGAFDEMKVELDDGEIVRMNPPYAPHGTAVAEVIVALATRIEGSGLRLSGEAGVVLADDTVFAFDAALVRGEVPEGRYRPDQLRLVVEVSDTSLDRDLGRKLREYARADVPLYWVVDVNARVTHVMSAPGENGFAVRDVVRFGESLELPDGLGSVVLG
jgi:Uma2 family endonuclease